MQPSKARFKLYMVLSICGVGRKFCGGKVLLEAQFVKVPFYYGSFPPPLPQIDPSAQHHPEWDLNYILWKEEQKISFLSLPISGWILTLGWQFGANPTEFEQNAKFRPIPGHNGQVGYKSELMSNILRWIMNALNDIYTHRCRCCKKKISSNVFLIKPSQVHRFTSNKRVLLKGVFSGWVHVTEWKCSF